QGSRGVVQPGLCDLGTSAGHRYAFRPGPLAQLAEQGTLNPKVEGSIPSRPISGGPRGERALREQLRERWRSSRCAPASWGCSVTRLPRYVRDRTLAASWLSDNAS